MHGVGEVDAGFTVETAGIVLLLRNIYPVMFDSATFAYTISVLSYYINLYPYDINFVSRHKYAQETSKSNYPSKELIRNG